MMVERWRDIPGYEGIYQVSDQGRVKNLRRGRLLRPGTQSNGYRKVILSRDGTRRPFLLHRLVALAFIPNPQNKPHINHKDGYKCHNYADNLEWCTMSENLIHRHRVLGLPGGHCKPVLCITTGQTYPSAKAAAEALGLHRSGVSQVCEGKQKTTKKFKFKFMEE